MALFIGYVMFQFISECFFFFFLWKFRARLLLLFKQQFLIFKKHYTYFHKFFHQYIFLKNTNNVNRNLLPYRPLIVTTGSWTMDDSIEKVKKFGLICKPNGILDTSLSIICQKWAKPHTCITNILNLFPSPNIWCFWS